MDIGELRQEVSDGKVAPDRPVDLIASQQKVIEIQCGEIDRLKEELVKNPTDRLDESYSVQSEEERQAQTAGKSKAGRSSKSPGRQKVAKKIDRAERTEMVFPQNCDPLRCRRSHTRVAWRLENGRAVLLAYEIYRLGNRFGQPGGLPDRGEFEMEILMALA